MQSHCRAGQDQDSIPSQPPPLPPPESSPEGPVAGSAVDCHVMNSCHDEAYGAMRHFFSPNGSTKLHLRSSGSYNLITTPSSVWKLPHGNGCPDKKHESDRYFGIEGSSSRCPVWFVLSAMLWPWLAGGTLCCHIALTLWNSRLFGNPKRI